MKPCKCGSGKTPFLLYDARGIPTGFVCTSCEDEHAAKFRPEIFTDNNYECDELIDDNY